MVWLPALQPGVAVKLQTGMQTGLASSLEAASGQRAERALKQSTHLLHPSGTLNIAAALTTGQILMERVRKL